ncbi:hypothetical protein BDK51DRAFT_49908 [Blyttiomyces helicus]|uniref:DNA mitochondrial polymerase exonuclease domain-containing protein n=1 Tax=Blyttiomyces helicus TaxID=388810 RepID=A0A4P9W1J9_9FUNG|nr:hypothetical protein BDK51DRAFT_49908 [Blyttiomyces helicus]|eukprot:RKO86059.1 hypothetical protein BDK51DRAFT_49908 [Blyttiomyces helicus]
MQCSRTSISSGPSAEENATDGDFEGSIAAATTRDWRDVGSMNALKHVAKLYLGKKMDKNAREIFETTDLAARREPESFQRLMSYCANDVKITHEVYTHTFLKFLAKCHHPVSFVGMPHMGKGYLTTDSEWRKYIDRVDAKYSELTTEVEGHLRIALKEALAASEYGIWKDDAWLRYLGDWDVPETRMIIVKPVWKRVTTKIVVRQETEAGKDGEEGAGNQVASKKVGQRKAQAGEDGGEGTGKQVAPAKSSRGKKVGGVVGQGEAGSSASLVGGKTAAASVVDGRANAVSEPTEPAAGPTYRLYKNENPELIGKPNWYQDSQTQTGTPLVFSTTPEDPKCDERASHDQDHLNFRIPHPIKEGANLGNPLTKNFAKAFAADLLSSSHKFAEEVLRAAAQTTYWTSARARIHDQLVVSNPEVLVGLVGRDDALASVMLPQSIVVGTITRRAVESL